MALDRIILDEIRTDKVVFDEYRRIVDNNPRIQEPADFHQWVLGNYGVKLTLQVRRLADNQSQSYSIRRLIGSMFQNHKLVTQKGYLNAYRLSEQKYAARMWVAYGASVADRTLPRGVFDADLKRLDKLSARATRLVDRDIAHLDRRRRERRLSYVEIFATLDAQAALLAKYADLAGYRMPGTISNGAYWRDWARHFEEPWVVRPTD